MPSRPGAPYGLLATTARNDYIFYANVASALHQQHIVMHELAHLVLGHDRAFPAAADEPLAAFAGLLDALPPELVVRVLGRHAYSEPQEQEAELLASLLLCRPPRRADTADSDKADEAHHHPGLGLLLGFDHRRKPAHG